MIIPSGFAQVNLKWSGASVPTGAECTYGVDISGYSGDPTDLGESVASAYNAANLDGVQVTTISLTSILVKFGPNVTGPSAEVATSFPGTISSPGNWPATSVLVQKNTSAGGRAGRGRMYWPGITESDVSVAGIVDTAYRLAMDTALTSFLDQHVVANHPMVLLHGDSSPIPTPLPILSLVPASQVATQRRRNRR